MEFQLEHKPDVPLRMLKYHSLLTLTRKVPVISCVIYLERRDYAFLPRAYVVEVKGKVQNSFHYQVVLLWDSVEEIRRGEWRGLAPLLPLLVPKE